MSNKIQIDLQKLVILYNEGLTIPMLAKTFNVSERTISRRIFELKQKGLIINNKKSQKLRFKHNEILHYVTEYIESAKKYIFNYNDIYTNIPLKTKPNTKKQSEDMVILWSDMHVGMINKNPLTGKITYNDEILEKIELPNFIKGIYRFYELYKPAYNIETLYILDLGDNITNDRIYEGQQLEITCNVGRQILRLFQYQSDFIKHMLKIFPNVVFVGVPGNHSRTTSTPISEDATNSFEFLKNQLLKERFRNNKRVKIIVPETYMYSIKIRGHKYLLLHGNIIRGTSLNSIEKATMQLADLAKQEYYDIIIMGHLHTALKLKIKPTTSLLVNGCWIDVDSYAYNTLRKYSTATQWSFLVSKKSPMHNLQEINLLWK